MSEQTAVESAQVKLKANGDLTITEDGVTTLIGNYNKASGLLEYATKALSQNDKLHNQVLSRIGSIKGGTTESQLKIRSIRVKGEAGPAKDAPKRPKMGPLGDAAEDYVQWMIEYDPAQAIIRYGIFTDSKGRMVKKRVRRLLVELVDKRQTHGDEDLDPIKQGKSQTKGPVQSEGEMIERNDGIIARRATQFTFTPNEVVGGFEPEEEFEQAEAGNEGGDE